MALLLITAAYLTSTVSGVVGMAGGAMLLSVMMIAGMSPVKAIALHAAVQLVSNLTRTYAHKSHVHWRYAGILVLFAIPGPYFGIRLVRDMDANLILGLLGILVVYATWAPKWGIKSLPPSAGFAVAGALAGALGVVIGAVGPLLAPFFLRDELNKRQIISTKAACQASIHVLKLIAFGAAGMIAGIDWYLFPPMAVAVIAGTYTGRWLLHRVSERAFIVLYKVVLTGLSARLLYQGFLAG